MWVLCSVATPPNFLMIHKIHKRAKGNISLILIYFMLRFVLFCFFIMHKQEKWDINKTRPQLKEWFTFLHSEKFSSEIGIGNVVSSFWTLRPDFDLHNSTSSLCVCLCVRLCLCDRKRMWAFLSVLNTVSVSICLQRQPVFLQPYWHCMSHQSDIIIIKNILLIFN